MQVNPATVHRFGLYDVSADKPRLSGVAVLGVPVSPAVLTKALPELVPLNRSDTMRRSMLLGVRVGGECGRELQSTSGRP